MKRQLNYWSKSFGVSNTESVNVSLSVDDKQFSIVFRRPGSVKPISQVAVDLNSEEIFNLKYAFESCGAQTFKDEMDERLYFANIARIKENAKSAEKFAVCVGYSILFYMVCMIVGVFLIKLHIILVLLTSIPGAVLLGFAVKNSFYNETKTSNGS